jgi:hypothetical protein
VVSDGRRGDERKGLVALLVVEVGTGLLRIGGGSAEDSRAEGEENKNARKRSPS